MEMELKIKSQAWWQYMPVISMLGKWREDNQAFKASLYCFKFKTKLGYKGL